MSTSLAPSPETLMVKTAKGSAEMSTREHRLGPRLRTILIMVDGKLTLAEITARAAALGNAAAIVGHLLDEGFIEAFGAGAESVPPAAMLPDAAKASPPAAANPPAATGAPAATSAPATISPPPEAVRPARPAAPAAASQPTEPAQPPDRLRSTLRLRPLPGAPPAEPATPPAPLETTQRIKVLPAAEPAKAPDPLEITQRIRALPAADAGDAPPDTGLVRTVRMAGLPLENGVDEATRNLVTELTRSGNLVTLRGDAMSGMRENDATNPARFFMRETIGKLLGGGAIGVLDGIDQATSRALLLAELDRCAQIIKDLKGEDEAAGFRISVLALLPE